MESWHSGRLLQIRRQIVEAKACDGSEHFIDNCNGEFVERIDEPKNPLHRLLHPAAEASESVLAKKDSATESGHSSFHNVE
jgi:hypothetical protein